MDPVLAAKKLIDSLVEEELKTLSEKKQNEDSVDEDPMEQENEDSVDEDPTETAGNKASVSMKPAAFGSNTASSAEEDRDAHGGDSKDAHGGREILQTIQYQDFSAQNRASVAMKPSFATSGVSSMSEEKVREDITSIFGSEELSEEFMNKAGSIYEAAVIAKANEVVQEIHEQYENAFNEEVENIKTQLSEQVDSYLNYVVEEWMEENKLAIESGIRTEIAENFIAQLKDLFMESYIEVPQNKTNLFDEMTDAISELENRVNQELEKNVDLVNENKALRAVTIFNEATKNLTDGEVDRISRLTENIEFITEDDFSGKVKTLVENITKKPAIKESSKKDNSKYLVETVIESEDNDVPSENPKINMYSSIISRMSPNN
jgi:hypothetical protein